jgi:hypothetical protein
MKVVVHEKLRKVMNLLPASCLINRKLDRRLFRKLDWLNFVV